MCELMIVGVIGSCCQWAIVKTTDTTHRTPPSGASDRSMGAVLRLLLPARQGLVTPVWRGWSSV
jgi:hypothetical protein